MVISLESFICCWTERNATSYGPWNSILYWFIHLLTLPTHLYSHLSVYLPYSVNLLLGRTKEHHGTSTERGEFCILYDLYLGVKRCLKTHLIHKEVEKYTEQLRWWTYFSIMFTLVSLLNPEPFGALRSSKSAGIWYQHICTWSCCGEYLVSLTISSCDPYEQTFYKDFFHCLTVAQPRLQNVSSSFPHVRQVNALRQQNFKSKIPNIMFRLISNFGSRLCQLYHFCLRCFLVQNPPFQSGPRAVRRTHPEVLASLVSLATSRFEAVDLWSNVSQVLLAEPFLSCLALVHDRLGPWKVPWMMEF